MKHVIGLMVVAVALVAAVPVVAQEQTPVRISAHVPLKVQLVVSRFQGEKKVSSVPYSLAVVANDNKETTLRMGVDIPVARDGGPNYTYRSVGTTIECSAQALEGGAFRLALKVSDSSIVPSDGRADAAAPVGRVSGMPAFRAFNATFHVLMRDGQTAQHTTATDPVSGEVMKIDVTVNVLK